MIIHCEIDPQNTYAGRFPGISITSKMDRKDIEQPNYRCCADSDCFCSSYNTWKQNVEEENHCNESDTELLNCDQSEDNHNLPKIVNIREEKIYQCWECHITFKKRVLLARHVRCHTGEKPYKCIHCGITFSRDDHLKRHVNVKHLHDINWKPYKCSHCDVAFKWKQSLNKHNLSHTDKNQCKCSHCGKAFSGKDNLKDHMGQIHGNDDRADKKNEKPFKCSQCDVAFKYNRSLTRHYITHTGEKPYKCGHCGSVFSLRHNLKNHIEQKHGHDDINDKQNEGTLKINHTKEEKPYKCRHCGMCFKLNQYLKRHCISHTSKKAYKCNHCGKIFSWKRNLNTHMKQIHRNNDLCEKSSEDILQMSYTKKEKSYKCSQCDLAFKYNRSLKRHNIRHTIKKL